MRTIERNIAVALVFSADGKVLQGQRNPKDGGCYADGYWILPGGGAEEGESIEQAFERELLEEMGLDVKGLPREMIDLDDAEAPKTLKSGERVMAKMKCYTFKAVLKQKASDVKICPGDDLAKFRWTDPKELCTLKLPPPSEKLFKRLGYL